MKKKLTVMLAAVMAFGMMAGCSSKEDANSNQGETGESTESLKDLDTSAYVTLGDYQGLTVAVTPKQEITDEKITDEINTQYLQSYAEEVEITDRPVQTGDTVHYSCVGTMDGVVFDGGSTSEGQQWDTVVGSGTMIDGFEDGFIGMESGQTKDIVCTFPEPYTPQPDYSGKEAVFTVTLNSVTVTEYPELTDDIVAQLELDFSTADELIENTRTQLEEEAQETYEDARQNAVLSAVLTNCEFQDPPQFLIDKNADALRENLEGYASMFGMDFATFLQQMYNMTEEDFTTQAQSIGASAAKESIAIEAIADAEGLGEVTEEELMSEAEDYIADSDYYTTTDALFEDVGKENFRDYVVSQRVITWLLENNTVE